MNSQPTGLKFGAILGGLCVVLVVVWIWFSSSGVPRDASPAPVVNRVLELDGKGSYVEIPPDLFTNLQEATVEGWVKWENFGYYSRIFNYGNELLYVSVDNFERGPDLQFELHAKGADNTYVTARNILETNQWFHIAAVSGQAGMKLYLNGMLIRSERSQNSFATLQNGYPNGPTNRFFFGHGSRGEDDFHGQMDEIRVWRVARTPAQLQENMLKRLTGREPGLAGLWNFDEITHGLVKDGCPQGHDGRMVGNARVVEAKLPLASDLASVEPRIASRTLTYEQIRILRSVIGNPQADKLKELLQKEPGLVHARYLFSPSVTECTPLHEAVSKYQRIQHERGGQMVDYTDGKHKEIVQLLLARKAEVNAQDQQGFAPLHVAAGCYESFYIQLVEHKVDLVPLLLARQANVNLRDRQGDTPLHVTAAKFNRAVAEALLAHQANVHARNNKGLTPLGVAVRSEATEPYLTKAQSAIIKTLQQHGATE
jgi:hypothetical protein